MFRFIAIAAALLFCTSTQAQWQTPIHSVPVGKGSGFTGFNNAAPGAAGIPLTSNGPTSDPSFRPVGNAGIAPGAINSVKGTIDGLSETDLPLPGTTCPSLQYTPGVGFSCNSPPANSVRGAITGGVATDLPMPGTNCSSLQWTFGTGFACGASSPMFVQITDPAYGAKCDGKVISSAQTYSITSGSNVLTTAGPFTFVAGDVGKSIWVPGAGAAGAGLSTTISGFNSGTSVTLAVNASTTVTSFAPTQANPVVYGHDDTAAINAAIAATPAFGTLFINPITASFPTRGCIIKQSGTSGRSLLVDHPINILGTGDGSELLTDPSMGSSVIGIHALVSGVTWRGITWQGFVLGVNSNFVPFSRFGAHGIWFDATSGGAGGFGGINLGPNLSIGESPNGYYSILMDGIATQGNRIWNNRIAGGIYLQGTADSNMILENRLEGVSQFGIKVDTAGAGNFVFRGNSTTLAGGVCIVNGSGITISDNFFEEETPTPQYPRNNFLDIGCGSGQTLNSVWITNNILLTGQSTTSKAVQIDATAVSTFLYGNEIANSNARTAVNNANATTVCGPNQWITSATHVSGTAPINWGPAC